MEYGSGELSSNLIQRSLLLLCDYVFNRLTSLVKSGLSSLAMVMGNQSRRKTTLNLKPWRKQQNPPPLSLSLSKAVIVILFINIRSTQILNGYGSFWILILHNLKWRNRNKNVWKIGLYSSSMRGKQPTLKISIQNHCFLKGLNIFQWYHNEVCNYLTHQTDR